MDEALLEREREIELVVAAKGGDRAALDRLWRHALPFAASMALPFAQRRNLDLGDLLGEMAIGFMKALERFDTAAGCRLLTYATWWFRDQLWRFAKSFRRRALDMTLTARERTAFRDISETGITDSEQLQARHGMRPRTVENALAAYAVREVSIDAPPPGKNGHHVGTSLRSEALDASEQLESAETNQLQLKALEQALTGLAPRSRAILLRRMEADPATFEELGPVFGIKRQRVQQIERRALWTVTQRVCELLGIPLPHDAKRPLTRRAFCTYCAKIGRPPEGHVCHRCPNRIGPDGRPLSRRRRRPKVAPERAAA